MTTHDKIELPPLPKFDRLSSMHADDVANLLHKYGRECARAAIEADRKRRGEPVGYVETAALDWLAETTRTASAKLITTIYKTASGEGIAPIFIGPQPAEPVKVPSVDEIMDAVMAYGSAHSNPQTTATERHARLNDVRTLLARYGKGTP